MSLKSVIFASMFAILLLILTVNTWFLHHLTESVSKQLGSSAFEVSKSTVESMLSHNLNREVLYIQHQFAFVGSDESSQPRTRVLPFGGQLNLAQSVELRLRDQQNSRSIMLKRGKQSVDIPIPRTAVEKRLETTQQQIILSSLLIMTVALILFYWLSRKLTQPLKTLCHVSESIGQGNFGIQVEQSKKPLSYEVNDLVNAVNKMSGELQRLEQEKQHWQEQKQTSELSDIARGLAHSIRNPLNTIGLSLGELAHRNPEQRSLTDIINTQIKRIDLSLKNLMAIATHEKIPQHSVDIATLCHNLKHEVEQQCAHTEVILEGEKELYVKGVESELYSVFHSLMINAAESYPAQQENGVITVILSTEGEQKTLLIKDQGQGIAQDYLDNLFKPHTSSKVSGSGMGLYIARRIVRGRYHGDIELLETSPAGSCFKITLNDRKVTE
ncbi:PAS domain-containing sensor histidine kinase [Pleionea sp. CnH1-48]|uniref:sensor histidine kinase n=1 Tax=Pleionea sp. CnH1-48 TaxID=2954494 RepID=UPI0020977DC8|nr:HAMP domain-containing sensor histidine kinase [Pleionea sp. CnH1-48]MCO7226065.1 HAMP domain-containing histidine kinase [Pleionea sp. CnH1-48]